MGFGGYDSWSALAIYYSGISLRPVIGTSNHIHEKESTMTDHETVIRTDHVDSVGTRVSWGAILAGCMTALGMYFLLTTLGAAVGLSISDRTNPSSLHTGAIVWAFLTTTAALFVGGVVTSLFVSGEDRIEAVLHGVIMWAALLTILLVMGTAGIQSGFNAMAVMANTAQNGTNREWEKAAQAAGVPVDQIADWQRRLEKDSARSSQDQVDQEAAKSTATRLAWCAFAGTWVSMIAGALGGLAGAGPTFRIVAVRSTPHRVAVS